MATKREKCFSCNGRGKGNNPSLGPWKCVTCKGTGLIPGLRKVRRTARITIGMETFPKDLPDVRDTYGRHLGHIVAVFEDGINVEHWDGELWSFYKWNEVGNAEEIRKETNFLNG